MRILKYLKNENFIIILVLLFTILPFIIISVYNNPGADDFETAYLTKKLGFWQALDFGYHSWNGRFFSLFLNFLNPLAIDSLVLYKFLPVVFIALFLLAVFLFSSRVLPRSFKKEKLTLSFIIVFSFFFQMPSVTQGMFWMPGCFTYTTASIILLFLATIYIYSLRVKSKIKKTGLIIVMSVFCVLIIGSNEVSMLILLALLALAFTGELLMTRKLNPVLLTLVFISVIACCFMIAAPGIDNRYIIAGIHGGHKFFFSAYKSIIEAARHIVEWSPVLLLLLLFFDDTLLKISDHFMAKFSRFKIPSWKLLLLFIIGFGIISVSFFPFFWVYCAPANARVRNVIYLLFIFEMIIFAVATVIYFKQKNISVFPLSKFHRIIVFLLLMFFLGFTKNNIRTVYYDLISGSAPACDKEVKERFEILRTTVSDTVVIDSIKHRPRTLFDPGISDITTDSANWKNKMMAHYFNKKSIVVAPGQQRQPGMKNK